MQTLQEVYIQNPFWVWLAVGAVFIALDIASGSGRLIWGGVAAAVLAFINLADVRLGAPVEIAIFCGVGLGGGVLAAMPWKRRSSSATPHDPPDAPTKGRSLKRAERVEAPEPPAADENRTARLIGRIGRTTGEFSNGVGRVWIDGSEWGAELHGDETLPSDTPVRVMGVTGGVRLHVRHLMTS